MRHCGGTCVTLWYGNLDKKSGIIIRHHIKHTTMTLTEMTEQPTSAAAIFAHSQTFEIEAPLYLCSGTGNDTHRPLGLLLCIPFQVHFGVSRFTLEWLHCLH